MKKPIEIIFYTFLKHLGVVVGLALVSLIYCYPIFSNKKLIQNDVIQAQGASQELTIHKQNTGETHLWTNSMFGGMPAFLVKMDYPSSFTTQVGRVITYALPAPANMIFLYFLGAYLMFVMLGYDYRISILGALGFGLGAYNIINIEAGHLSKVVALAFAPALIGAVAMTYRGNIIFGSALAGLFTGLQLYGNHVQITYYLFIALGIYAFYELITQVFLNNFAKNNLKDFTLASLALVLTIGLAIGSHASRLITNYEYTKYTIRAPSELAEAQKQKTAGADRDYAFQWSYGMGESFTFLIPNFVGRGSGAGEELKENSVLVETLQANNLNSEVAKQLPIYWGDQPFTSGPAYIGAVVIFLMVFGLFHSQNPLKWYLLSIFLLFTSISWGKNFFLNDVWFNTLPMFSKFRAHTMILSLNQIFAVWLAVLGVQSFFQENEGNKTKLQQNLIISASFVGGICLFFALMGGFFQDFKPSGEIQDNGKGQKVMVNPDDMLSRQLRGIISEAGTMQVMKALKDERANMQANDAWRSAGFILMAGALIFALAQGWLQSQYVVFGLLALITFDLWQVDRRYFNDDNFKDESEAQEVFDLPKNVMEVKHKDTGHYRVFYPSKGITSDATVSYHFKNIGGYHGAKLRRYQELIEKHIQKNNIAVFNMLNTKYIFQENDKRQVQVAKNPDACGNAWFVPQIKIVNSPDEELQSLEKFEPKNVAFVDKKFEKLVLNTTNANFDSTATIHLEKYSPAVISYKSQSKVAQNAIFSEIFYQDGQKMGWKCYIDGKETPHFRANYVLRGVQIPAGAHNIIFKFETPIYNTGETISLICSLLLFVAIGFGVYLKIKNQSV